MALSQLVNNCTPEVIPFPSIFGAAFTSVQASVVQNYSSFVPGYANYNHGDIDGRDMSLCNITITHTHPGQHDTIITKVWLPIQPAWNQRLQAVGGGGYIAGLHPFTDLQMTGALAEGYATVTSNGGVLSQFPIDWALLSPGNVDLLALQNFAHVALKDSALVAKSVIKSFYGQAAKFSYWSGCSQGGRQGLAFAQRYPDVFNGIAAAAPAINWHKVTVADHFPQQVMNEMREYPHPCELDALTMAAIKACDGNDGVIDGIISDPDSCHFNPYSIIGTSVNCSSSSAARMISKAAAVVADAAWNGARDANGSFLWHTAGHTANLTAPTVGIASTTCSANGTCTGTNVTLVTDWVRLFVEKDPNYDLVSMSRQDYVHAFRQTILDYESLIGTNSPDLSEFRKAGGKMITYHGLADEIIPFRNSRQYYDAVTALDPKVHDFYRLFESPGLGHCYGGIGGYPSGTFDAVVKWVEEGVVPEMLVATSVTNRSTVLHPYNANA
ncbi:feruloyl esterase [Byssothecium circinans]|uniref:Carboxylic ester hydrolase n=1 Tax=Byssothecium circinans TaxID=147558 RepID=A0A6A5U1B5_9PLEO|nr:feruloyl esterase [Byssothecium circinans]